MPSRGLPLSLQDSGFQHTDVSLIKTRSVSALVPSAELPAPTEAPWGKSVSSVWY